MGIMTGQVAVITGAGTGLGKAAAIRLAAEGAQVVLVGRRFARLEEVRGLIQAAGGLARAVQADVSAESDVRRLAEQVRAEFGRLDVLINNAAVVELGSLYETTPESWNYQLQVNLTGPFLMTRALLPLMRERRYGRIVNITSGLAVNGAGGYAAYSASKAGLESLTRTAAEEEASHGILVNLYNPGTIRSEMHATGKDPATVAPDLLTLATLPKHGPSGLLFEAGFASKAVNS